MNVERIEALAKKALSRVRIPHWLRDDALGEAAVAVIEAERRYDASRCDNQDAWAVVYARFRLRKWLAAELSRPAAAVIEEWHAVAPGDSFEYIELLDVIERTLSPRERAAILAVGAGERYADVCRRYRVSARLIGEWRSRLRHSLTIPPDGGAERGARWPSGGV